MSRKDNRVEFSVNGRKCSVEDQNVGEMTLNAYIRYKLGLPGTKAMCHEGGCGSCIVAVRARRQTSGHVELFSVNSCLVLVFSCHGWDITTIEGIGNRQVGYSDIQKRITAFNATQCGYCTPGWAMHLYSLQDKHLNMLEMERAFASNTCRCTGFRPIMDTVKSFAVDASPDLCQTVRDIEELRLCEKTNGRCERKCSLKSLDSDWSVVNEFDNLSLSQNEVISLTSNERKFFKVYTEEQIFKVFADEGIDSYMLIDGNTGKGVYETFEYPRVLIDISDVKSLKQFQYDQNLVLGANISIQDCITIFKEAATNSKEFFYLGELAKHLDLVAHIPVRKIGSIAGNLMLKHAMPEYPSDLFVILETVGAVVIISNGMGVQLSLPLTQFLKYDMSGKILVSVGLPPLVPSRYIYRSYKIMPRHQNSLAIVNAGFLLDIDPKTALVKEASIVYGNIRPDFIHATATETYLKGRNIYSNDTFVLNISPTNVVDPRNRSGGLMLARRVSSGRQDFQTNASLYPLNQPVPKLEAIIQSAGEARYANDVPNHPNQVFGAFALSTVASGKVDVVNVKKLMETPGILAVYTAKDIPGKNSFTKPGLPLQTEDEEILATNIKFYGQPIAIVVATSEALAAKGAKRLEVTYKDVKTSLPVLTIDDAKRDGKRYLASDNGIKPKDKGNNVKKIIKGIYEIESQYHYYIEPISNVVVPVDRGYEVYDSSQWMDLCQIAVSQCLGIKESDVMVKVRRVGGGFGGKISRNVQATAACAVVACKQNAPCRFILPLQTNLSIAGKRLPCQCDYEVGVDENGKIQYLNATIIEDDGCSHNENILSYVAGGFPNCYNPDRFNLKTGSVVTDLPSNSFARGPGTTEAISCIENIMEHIAFAVKKDATEVRLVNMRTEDNDLPALIAEYKKETDYDKRVKDIEQYNKANRWMKRAISIDVMSFPVEYYGNYSAMVSIYRGDGTVTITTGGIEMGQGCNTKVAQVCAYELGIPLECISVLPHYSFAAANNILSGSSITTECASYATIKCCEMLKMRLEPIKAKMTDPTWKELIAKAGDEQVDLTAIYMMTDKEKDLSKYSAFAVAILEAQLDVLTGRFEIVRADILEDAGLSANPKLDVGQVEGGYVQGLGYYTCERLVHERRTGKLLTNRSLTYHVPLALDIPAEFNVKLRYNSKNNKGVLGSKSVGEMGMCTAHGILHALRRCIHESRMDSGYDENEWINISVPYETESILKALDVKLSEMRLS
ncbi:hypothetical protein ACJJTC_009485 [Scirpophaga incertulas]